MMVSPADEEGNVKMMACSESIRLISLLRCVCVVDVLIVIGNEKLTIEMQKLFSRNGVTVISAPKSGGVSPLLGVETIPEYSRRRLPAPE